MAVVFELLAARTPPKYSRSRDQRGSRQCVPLKMVTNMLFNFNERFCISNLITALSSPALNCRWLLITCVELPRALLVNTNNCLILLSVKKKKKEFQGLGRPDFIKRLWRQTTWLCSLIKKK